MKVKAAQGVRVPMDSTPRQYITDAQEVDVGETPYYLLRLKDGDLIRTDLPTNAGMQSARTSALPSPAVDAVSE